MSGPRLLWPRKLADVIDFPAALVEPLAAHGLVTVADLVARIRRDNPGFSPPSSCYYMHLRLNSYPLPDQAARDACSAGMRALVNYLDYREYQRPVDWTDPPGSKPKQERPNVSKVEMFKPSELVLHEQAHLVPEMPADQYAVFLADVKKRHAIDKPLERIPGTNVIIDGRTRLRAATDANLDAVPVVDADLGDDSPVVYMLRVAYLRRNLKPAQAAALGLEIKKQFAAEMRRRKREGGKKGGEKSAETRRGDGESKHAANGTHASTEEPGQPKKREPGAREQAAALSGSSARSITDAEQIAAKAPAVFEQMKSGQIATVAEAKRAAGIHTHSTPKPAKSEPEKPAGIALTKKQENDPKLGIVGATYLAGLDGFPDAVADELAPGITTVETLLERVSDKVRIDLPLRNKIVTFLVNTGFKLKPAEKAADAVAQHDVLGGNGKPSVAHQICATLHELNPCPFCGSTGANLVIPLDEEPAYIRCANCDARGPADADKDVARANWNKRAKK